MKNNQQGFIGIILVVIVAIALGIGGTYWYLKKDVTPQSELDIQVNTANTEASTTTSVENTYRYPNMTTGNTTTAPQSKFIIWSFDSSINKPGEDTERRDEVIISIDGITYRTGIRSIGCGKEVASVKLLSGQLSAIVCGPYAGSATEFSVYKEGSGFKIVSTDLAEYPLDSGQYKRGSSRVVLNITSSGSIRQTLANNVFIEATKDPSSKIMAHGDINNDGYSDAILMVSSCGASCSSDLVVVLNQNNISAKVISTATFAPAFNSSSASKSAIKYVAIADNGIVSLSGMGLACTPPGSELSCTQERWNIVKTINYRFEGGKMIQIN